MPVGRDRDRAVYFNTSYTDEERRISDHSHRSCCGFSVFIAASGCFTRRWGGRAAGPLGRLDLDLGNGQRTRASGCCSRRGHPGHVGVQFVATRALDQRRARIRRRLASSWGLYGRFNRVAPAALHLPGGSDRLGGLPATRSIFSLTAVAGRAALGVARGVGAITRVSIWRGLIRGAV